jgi:hypothetical protein
MTLALRMTHNPNRELNRGILSKQPGMPDASKSTHERFIRKRGDRPFLVVY